MPAREIHPPRNDLHSDSVEVTDIIKEVYNARIYEFEETKKKIHEINQDTFVLSTVRCVCILFSNPMSVVSTFTCFS
uniref:Uncharacterized protein n=1 Tax=Kalanchoe fedtschenkoi TaxID=63787 RepID=A0A7N0REI2_KALFE